MTRFSNELAQGETLIIQKEKAGYRYKVTRIKKDLSEEAISKDYYPPQNRIILKSTEDATDNDKIEQVIDMTESGMDLNGDGLDDVKGTVQPASEQIEETTIYDKGGNIISK